MKLSTQIGLIVSGGVLALVTAMTFLLLSSLGEFAKGWGAFFGLNFALVGLVGFVLLMDAMFLALLFYAIAAKKSR